MAIKLLLNVLYTIGIVICVLLAWQYGIEQHRYEFLVGSVFMGTILVILKIRLMKEVRNMQKP